jgi:succinate dehydrogenase/fumarate reductase cytochrome b subunit
MMESSTSQPNALPPAGAPSSTAYNHPLLQARAAVQPGCKCQRLLWPRRIHALLGLTFTLFLLLHLCIAAMGVDPSFYQRTVDWAEHLRRRLPGVELLFVFAPFAAQAGIGLYLLWHEGMKYNVKKCNRGGKLRFFLQRVSALVILAFVLFHVATMHRWGGGLFQPQGHAFESTVLGLGLATSAPMSLLLSAFTLLALLATAFHAANGAWSGGIVWKLPGKTIREHLWAALCVWIGLSLALLGCIAFYAFTLSARAAAILAR